MLLSSADKRFVDYIKVKLGTYSSLTFSQYLTLLQTLLDIHYCILIMTNIQLQVSIPGLNDSQYIGLCIYNVAVLSILGVIINFVLKEVELKYIFTSGFIIFSTTMTQLIIFVPKVRSSDTSNEVHYIKSLS